MIYQSWIVVIDYHVIVGDVNVGVADAAELDVEGDIIIASDVSLNLNLLKGSIRTVLGPSRCAVHVGHPLK